MPRSTEPLLMWKPVATSPPPASASRRVAEIIGVHFSLGFRRLHRKTRIARGVKTPSNRAMATVRTVR
jgi:hypothetical protein